jgi:hypothetical protein
MSATGEEETFRRLLDMIVSGKVPKFVEHHHETSPSHT